MYTGAVSANGKFCTPVPPSAHMHLSPALPLLRYLLFFFHYRLCIEALSDFGEVCILSSECYFLPLLSSPSSSSVLPNRTCFYFWKIHCEINTGGAQVVAEI